MTFGDNIEKDEKEWEDIEESTLLFLEEEDDWMEEEEDEGGLNENVWKNGDEFDWDDEDYDELESDYEPRYGTKYKSRKKSS